jgi:hypothetical protein
MDNVQKIGHCSYNFLHSPCTLVTFPKHSYVCISTSPQILYAPFLHPCNTPSTSKPPWLQNCLWNCFAGRAVVQAVSSRLPTAAAQVSQGRSCGLCRGQIGTGAGLRVLRFPLPILTPPTAPHSSSIIQGWYNNPNSGRRTKWTQSHPTPRN